MFVSDVGFDHDRMGDTVVARHVNPCEQGELVGNGKQDQVTRSVVPFAHDLGVLQRELETDVRGLHCLKPKGKITPGQDVQLVVGGDVVGLVALVVGHGQNLFRSVVAVNHHRGQNPLAYIPLTSSSMKTSSNHVTVTVELYQIEDDDVFRARLKYAPPAWNALDGDQRNALGLLLRSVFLQLADTPPVEWIPKGLIFEANNSYALILHIDAAQIDQAVIDIRLRAEQEQSELIDQLTTLGQELTDG